MSSVFLTYCKFLTLFSLLKRRNDTRGDFGKRQEYRSTILTLIVYRDELARTLPPERETAGKSTATIWSSPRVKMPPGVKSGQS